MLSKMQETMHNYYQSGLLSLSDAPPDAPNATLSDSQSDVDQHRVLIQAPSANKDINANTALLSSPPTVSHKSASQLLIDLYTTEEEQELPAAIQEKPDTEQEKEHEQQLNAEQAAVRVMDDSNDNDDDAEDEHDGDIMETVSTTCFKWYSFLNTLDQNDKHYTTYIQQLEFGCIFELFMLIPTIMYSVIGIAILVLIYSIVFRSLLYFVNVVLCLVINEAIKRRIKRKRPNIHSIAERMVALDGVLLVKKSASMPSGDTAQCTVFACTMIYTMLWEFHIADITWWWMLITIPVVAFERIYFGKHWLGDTLCGAIEGALIVIVVCSTFGPYLFF